MLCISGQKRNKDNPIEQLKHFLGEKDFSENQHSNHVQFKPRIGDNLVAQSQGESDGGARRKISRTPLKGSRILFYGRVPNSFPTLRGNNSTTTYCITGTANFNSNKDNFRTLSSQGLFESIVINLYPDQSI